MGGKCTAHGFVFALPCRGVYLPKHYFNGTFFPKSWTSKALKAAWPGKPRRSMQSSGQLRRFLQGAAQSSTWCLSWLCLSLLLLVSWFIDASQQNPSNFLFNAKVTNVCILKDRDGQQFCILSSPLLWFEAELWTPILVNFSWFAINLEAIFCAVWNKLGCVQ